MTWLVVAALVAMAIFLWRERHEARRWNREIDTLLQTKEKR